MVDEEDARERKLQREAVAELRKSFAEEQARWQRKIRRSQIIARWFLVPYCLAGGLAGWQIGVAGTYSLRLALLLGVAFTVIVFAQWTQPYLTRRGDRKDSIKRTDGDQAVSVEESATTSE